MSQDSKINAEAHGLWFGDQQKPKQIQMHMPQKNIRGGRRSCSQGGGGEKKYLGPEPQRVCLITRAPVSLRGSRTNEEGRETEAVGPMMH